MDSVQETPRKNKRLGLLADALRSAVDYADRPRGDASDPDRKANPVASMLAQAMALRSIANVADDISYGRAPTKGRGMTLALNEDAKEAAMTMAPFPRTSAKAAMALAGADNAAERAAIVWHGSPHKFDRFDASKIGTGEGAQAYGHGLYLAESPNVAKEYQRALGTAIDLEGKPVMRAGKLVGTTGNRQLDSNMELYAGDLNQGIKDQLSILRDKRYRLSLDDDKASWTHKANKQVLKDEQQQLAAMRNLRNNGKFFNDGSIYKVDLPDPLISRMLDWDKPLSQQAPEVQKALNSINPAASKTAEQIAAAQKAYEDANYLWMSRPSGLPKDVEERLAKSAGQAYENWQQMVGFGDKKGAYIYNQLARGKPYSAGSEALRQAGIPGIRYLDGGSRGAGAGTSNFVVFPGEENALTILERNDQPVQAVVDALRKKRAQ